MSCVCVVAGLPLYRWVAISNQQSRSEEDRVRVVRAHSIESDESESERRVSVASLAFHTSSLQKREAIVGAPRMS